MTEQITTIITKSERKFLWFSAAVLLVLVLLNSINSINYFNPDEHYQIIEFAGYKQGKIQKQDLAWEFEAQSRQAVQPFICYLVFESCNVIGISEPINQIRTLRIITGIFSIFCICMFVKTALRFFKSPFRLAFIAVSFVAWFVPYYYVRFTSESVSQSLFLLALSLALRRDSGTIAMFLLGFILGLAFYIRFQTILLITGLLVGIIFIEKYSAKQIFKILFGGIIALFAGFLIDKWFYGNWVFTPWTYFDQQVLNNVASQFGKKPFYFYFVELFYFSTPVVGLLIYFSLGVIPILKKLNTIYLVFIISLILLSVIGHKEFRFLIAIINLLPFLVVFAIQELNQQRVVLANIFTKKWFIIFLLIFNTGAILFSTAYNNNLFSDNNKALSYVISRDYLDKKVHLLYFDHTHPFKDDVVLKFKNDTLHLYQRFIMPQVFSDQQLTLLDTNSLEKNPNADVQLLYIRKSKYLGFENRGLIKEYGYELKYVSAPMWLENLFNSNKSLGKQYNDWVMYIFEKK